MSPERGDRINRQDYSRMQKGKRDVYHLGKETLPQMTPTIRVLGISFGGVSGKQNAFSTVTSNFVEEGGTHEKTNGGV